MAEKNILMQRKKADGTFDQYYPQTIAELVKMSDETTLETWLIDAAKFKKGNSSFTDNDTSQTFTDAFCTANSLVVVSITSATPPQGVWSVESGAGSFTITSTVAESADITFDYFIIKVV